jgi:predicted Rdx family selenoprotein
MKPQTGAQFEISIDGTLRTYRDTKEIAFEAARVLKSRNPNSEVKVRDLVTGETTTVVYKPS